MIPDGVTKNFLTTLIALSAYEIYKQMIHDSIGLPIAFVVILLAMLIACNKFSKGCKRKKLFYHVCCRLW